MAAVFFCLSITENLQMCLDQNSDTQSINQSISHLSVSGSRKAGLDSHTSCIQN